MDHSTHAGSFCRAKPLRRGRVVLVGLLAVTAGACGAEPAPSTPFDGVARVAIEATTTNSTTSPAPASPSTTAPAVVAAPDSNDVALASTAPLVAPPVVAPVASAEAAATSIEGALAEVDALLDDVDRDLADATDTQ